MLFSPLRIRSLTLKNRVALAPMCQYSARDGVPQPWHLVHLGARAAGGAGVVMTEATAVSPEGRITPGCTGIWNDDQQKAWAPIARFIHDQGAVPAMQLAHAGRKVHIPYDAAVVGPSAMPFSDEYPTPYELTSAEINTLIQKFGCAATRAHAAGFQVLELHMAHGFLLHSFLSPLSNHRSDIYGGSLENRMRFPLAVVDEVRRRLPPDFPLWVRISATDWVDGGWDLEQSVQFCKALKERGVDLIDVSSGGSAPDAVVPMAPNYQVAFSSRIRSEAGIMTGAVGLITEAHQADAILREGSADIVLLGRELLRNPFWPLHAARELGVDMPWPPQYQSAR